jgi:hypothetical protein
MPALDYEQADQLLADLFREAEAAFQENNIPIVNELIQNAADRLFVSSTQSYREALLGWGLARLLDRSINIRRPYMNQGEHAFNGRTLDEKVVNPFLQDRMIPSSKGPYLASFRRSVKFIPETAGGLRDKEGYNALLDYITALERANGEQARSLVLYLLYRFVMMRDAANVPLSRISRLSLEQYQMLVTRLLQVQSGGLIPVLLSVALLRTIKQCYALPWVIAWQGINVSDKASGAGGDITVSEGETIVLAIEVTERPIEKSRVVSTFNTKIMRGGIEDYLFIYSSLLPTDGARQAARTYFNQGHEINFLHVADWVVNNLGTIGGKYRTLFTKEILLLLDTRDVPASVKMAWNDIVKGLVSFQ